MSATWFQVHPAAAQTIEGPVLRSHAARRLFISKDSDTGLPRPNITGTSPTLNEFVAPKDILLDIEANGKRAALSQISKALGLRVGKSQGAVLKALLRRERLGPTSIGGGVALPHARLESITRPAAILAQLRHPVVFGGPDDEPVDLIVAVLWPEADAKGFVPALAGISRLLRCTELASALRRSKTPRDAHVAITESSGNAA